MRGRELRRAHWSASSSARWAHWAKVSSDGGIPVLEEPAHDALGVVGDAVGGDLETADRAAEARLVAVGADEPAAEVHLVPRDLLARVVHDQLALEPDVGGLDARARVGAAVDVERDRMRQLELVETLLEVEHGGGRERLGLDDRELAELDAGARDGAAADQARARRQPELVEARDERLDAVFGDVEDDDLLMRGRAQPGRAVRLDEVGELREGRPRDAADDRRGADVEPAVLLPVHADVVAVRERLRRGGTVGQRVPEVLVLQHLAELLGAPLGEEELQARLVAQAPVAVVAEDLRDAVPGIRHLLGRHEDAEALGQPRRGRQAAAHPQVVADAELGMLDRDERDVVDLVHDVLARVPGDRGLELAGEVRQRLVADEASR